MFQEPLIIANEKPTYILKKRTLYEYKGKHKKKLYITSRQKLETSFCSIAVLHKNITESQVIFALKLDYQ